MTTPRKPIGKKTTKSARGSTVKFKRPTVKRKRPISREMTPPPPALPMALGVCKGKRRRLKKGPQTPEELEAAAQGLPPSPASGVQVESAPTPAAAAAAPAQREAADSMPVVAPPCRPIDCVAVQSPVFQDISLSDTVLSALQVPCPDYDVLPGPLCF